VTIRQFNATYLAEEDRILLRVTLASDEEFRFWLTRACLRGFFRQVEAWLTPDNASAAAAVKAFQREAGVARADFQSPLQPGETFPLGEAPVLVKAIDIDTDIGGQSVRVTLQLVGNRQGNFNINDEILSSVHAMLKQAVQVADWGIATTTFAATPVPAAMRVH
jgi:hypothetical protein